MNVFDYIDLTRICFLKSTEKERCIEEIVDASADCLHDRERFLKSIMDRENLMSTGLGFELAFPHSKSDSVVDFFISIGISSCGIDWKSFDERPVKMVFLIGGPVEEQERYLRLLAALSNLVKNENNRNELLLAQDQQQFYDTFSKLALMENQAV